jgi:hypothetical protein
MSSQCYDERRRQMSTLAAPLPQRMVVGSNAEFGAATCKDCRSSGASFVVSIEGLG